MQRRAVKAVYDWYLADDGVDSGVVRRVEDCGIVVEGVNQHSNALELRLTEAQVIWQPQPAVNQLSAVPQATPP